MKKKIKTSRWDAELDSDICDPYTNAEVTLILRLGFRQVNPAGGAAAGTYHDYGDATSPSRKIVKWTAAQWTQWTQELSTSAQRYWNGKFWLVSNFPDLEFTVAGATYRPNVYCKLKIVPVMVTAAGVGNAHHTIDVVRLDPAETWFGSHSTLYDSLDTTSVQKGTDSKGRPIMQRAHVHEIGHLLGLGHVDIGKAHCPAAGDTNASACYGVSDRNKNSVMGQGMGLRLSAANPWRRAIVQLTGKGQVTKHSDWEAKIHREYPRTAAEVVANRSITVRLART